MKVVVSTVGRLRKDMVSNTYEELGYNRYFETMAFMAKEDDKYNDADVEREYHSMQNGVCRPLTWNWKQKPCTRMS